MSNPVTTPLTTKKRKAKTSWVWQYLELKDGKVHCKICNELINWNKDGSAQLKWHLNSKHDLNSALSTPKPKALDCEIESEHEFHDENHEHNQILSNKKRKIDENLVKFIIGTNSSITLVSNPYF